MAKTQKNEQIKDTGGKRIRNARKLVNLDLQNISDAIGKLKEVSKVKFDETVELVIKLGVDAKQSDEQVRGAAELPHGNGKKIRIAAFVKDENVKKALDAGATLAGSDTLVEQIKAGKIDFDVCIATPDMMTFVSQVAKILGPKGLMPNPKLGTVTPDFEGTIKSAVKGRANFRIDKAGILHVGVGKLSFDVKALEENIKVLVQAIIKAKPAGSKGVYLKAGFLTSTMGPSIRLDLNSVTN